MNENKPYEPFGEEWKNEMMKKPKSFLVAFLASICQRLIILEEAVAEDSPKEPQTGRE